MNILAAAKQAKPVEQTDPGLWVVVTVVFCLGLVLVLCWAALPKKFSTRKARKIFGRTGNAVLEGYWTTWIESLYRDWETCEFFLFYIDELNKPIIKPIRKQQAEDWVIAHADPEHARDLLREWFTPRY